MKISDSPLSALLPNDYYHIVTCPEVVTISDKKCNNVIHTHNFRYVLFNLTSTQITQSPLLPSKNVPPCDNNCSAHTPRTGT